MSDHNLDKDIFLFIIDSIRVATTHHRTVELTQVHNMFLRIQLHLNTMVIMKEV